MKMKSEAFGKIRHFHFFSKTVCKIAPTFVLISNFYLGALGIVLIVLRFLCKIIGNLKKRRRIKAEWHTHFDDTCSQAISLS